MLATSTLTTIRAHVTQRISQGSTALSEILARGRDWSLRWARSRAALRHHSTANTPYSRARRPRCERPEFRTHTLCMLAQAGHAAPPVRLLLEQCGGRGIRHRAMRMLRKIAWIIDAGECNLGGGELFGQRGFVRCCEYR